MCLDRPQNPETRSLPPIVWGSLPQMGCVWFSLNWFFWELVVLKRQQPTKQSSTTGMVARRESQSGQSRRQWHWTEKAKGMKTQSPNTSIQPNSSLMISQVVSIFYSFQKQSSTQRPVKAWYSHILVVMPPCLSAWRARKEKLSTSQKIIATLQPMNFMSKLPILGFSSLPTQKSNPRDPCECESTSSPQTLTPNLPLMQRRAATAIATRLTVDHRGQKLLTRALSWKSCTPFKLGKMPPNSSIIEMVRTVSRNPQMEQVS